MSMQKFKDDQEAMLHLADGNLDAYRFLFDHYYSDLCNFLLIYLHSKELAEDIALDIFTFVWEKRQSIQIKANFKSFLFAAAKNKAITLYRKEHQKIFTSIDVVESAMPNDSSSQFTMENNELDDDGVADFAPMYNAGLVKRGAVRNFDATKQYLWPIPSKEILINQNLKQNTGY